MTYGKESKGTTGTKNAAADDDRDKEAVKRSKARVQKTRIRTGPVVLFCDSILLA